MEWKIDDAGDNLRLRKILIEILLLLDFLQNVLHIKILYTLLLTIVFVLSYNTDYLNKQRIIIFLQNINYTKHVKAVTKSQKLFK